MKAFGVENDVFAEGLFLRGKRIRPNVSAGGKWEMEP